MCFSEKNLFEPMSHLEKRSTAGNYLVELKLADSTLKLGRSIEGRMRLKSPKKKEPRRNARQSATLNSCRGRCSLAPQGMRRWLVVGCLLSLTAGQGRLRKERERVRAKGKGLRSRIN
ncbi:hypothetical protein B0H12DRAFT_1157063 [Mycena haematopus]|nr:hypothetical protein B0H12DRAFT_1157063 [Mycena haematopus]